MNNIENNLIFLYTIIAFILIVIENIILKKSLKYNIEKSKHFPFIILTIVIAPFCFVALFFTFALIEGFVDMCIENDFITKQLLINIPNYFILYYCIKMVKTTKKE